MNKKSMCKAIVAIAVALAFLLPTSAAIVNVEETVNGNISSGDVVNVIDLQTLDADIDIETPEPLTVDWWPMFHHDPEHSGYSTSTAPDTNNSLWNYTTGGDVDSSPAVVDGKVFFGSDDNKVYCLDASDGTFLWSYTTGASIYHSSPAVADGKVYFGSDDDNIYCLDASDGTFLWSYNTGDGVDSSPAVADGRVFFGSIDGKVYCLDASDGTFLWSYTTGGSVYGSPAVANGKVYVGSVDDNVYCLDAATGAFIWSYATGYDIRKSSPSVADGKVFIGSIDRNLYCLDALTGDFIWKHDTGGSVQSSPAVVDGKVFIGSLNGNIYCLDASNNGDTIWCYSTGTGSGVRSSPAVVDGKVFVGSNNLYCLDASNGDFIWSYDAGGSVNSSPAVADGKVFVGSDDDKLYCFGQEPGYDLDISVVGNGTTDPSEGVHRYPYDTVVDLEAFPDPCYEFAGWSGDITTMDNPTTITMDDNKTVTATFTETNIIYDLDINIVGSGTTDPSEGVHSYLSGAVVNLEAFPDLYWVFSDWSGDIATTDNPTNITMDDNKTVTATFTETPPPEITDVMATPPSQVTDGYVNITATVIDDVAVDTVMVSITSPPGGPPVDDWWPTFMHDVTNTGNSTSTAPAPDTDNLLWTFNTGGDGGYSQRIQSSPAVVDGKVFVGSNNGNIYCLDMTDGSFVWSYTTGDEIYTAALTAADGRVYCGGMDDKVRCLDEATGSLIWEYTTGWDVYSAPTVVNGKVFFGSCDRNLYCLDAADGSVIWIYTAAGYVYSAPAVTDGKVYFADYSGTMYCLDESSGSLIWSYFVGGGVCMASPSVADGRVYINSLAGKLFCLDAATGSHIWNYTTGQSYSSPAVAYGKVYMNTYLTDGKLFCLDAATGSHIWNYTTGKAYVSSPAVADGKVYIGSHGHGKLYCFDAEDGSHIWSYAIGTTSSAPAVADGKVFIGSYSGTMYCFGPGPEHEMTNIPGTDTYYYNATYTNVGTYDYFIWANDTGGNENTSDTYQFEITGYALDISVVGGGATNPSAGVHSYSSGTVVELKAFPDAGWSFVDWSGDISTTDNPTTITMDGNKAVTATFIETHISYDLDISIVGGGTTDPSAGVHSYPSGTVVDLEAFPDAGWSFVDWSGDIATMDNPTMITMDGNKSVTATFIFTDVDPPEITGITMTTSDPIDTNPLYGWENVTCTVIDDGIGVDEVKLVVTDPDTVTTEYPMTNIPGTDTYYYETTFIIEGCYEYHIWADDISDNEATSSSEQFGLPPNEDVDMNGRIHFMDLVAVVLMYGDTGPPGWVREDVDNDGQCHFMDLVAIVLRYGEYWDQC